MNSEYFDKRIPLMVKLGFRQESVSLLKKYIDLLWSSNEDLNIISRKMSYEELIDNHLIDCLLPISLFPKSVTKLADFGSGGGLPGVIFALNFPEVEFHLFEKRKKKQKFLTSCKSLAPNLEIHGEIPFDFSDFDLVTARAFKPIDVILDMSRKYFFSQGKYFLLKARGEKIEEELRDARKKFKDLRVKLVSLESPVLEVERNLVLINP